MMTRRQFVMRGGLLVPAAGLLTSNVRAAAASYLQNRRKAFRSSWELATTTGLQFGYEARFATFSDGDSVGTWTSLAGVAPTPNAIQSTAANKPIFSTGQVNGHPAVVFDGTSDYLDTTWSATAANQTIVAVWSPTSTSGSNKRIFSQAATTSSDDYLTLVPLLNDSGIGAGTYADSGYRATRSYSAATWYVTVWVRSGSTITQYKDGVASSSYTWGSSSQTIGVFRMANSVRSFGVFEGLQIKVALLAVSSIALGTTERQSVEDYCGTTYGITITH